LLLWIQFSFRPAVSNCVSDFVFTSLLIIITLFMMSHKWICYKQYSHYEESERIILEKAEITKAYKIVIVLAISYFFVWFAIVYYHFV
jgi:hypothetical protein